MMRKQLNNYDGVLSQLKVKEEIEMADVDKGKPELAAYQDKENAIKEENIEHEALKKSSIKEKVEIEENQKTGSHITTKISPKGSENDNAEVDNKSKARWCQYDLGFLQSKLIKNIFCCLSEHQQIGGKIFQ